MREKKIALVGGIYSTKVHAQAIACRIAGWTSVAHPTLPIVSLALSTLLFAVFASPAIAIDWQQKGHLKYFYNHAWYDNDAISTLTQGKSPATHQINARYDGEAHWDAWQAQFHYALSATGAEDRYFSREVPTPDKTQTMRLGSWIVHDEHTQVLQRVDRFNLGYTRDHWTLRAGRQAVSWGNGMNFHPLDIFNPFRPNAIDKDYKNGDDLLYGQWLFDDGADAQWIAIPRRDPVQRDISAAQSSSAIKYHRLSSFGDWDVLAARHYEDTLLGLGWSKSLGGAVVRADATLTRLKNGSNAVAGIVNADYSWNWFGYNVYGYAEYYYQSLGMKSPYTAEADALRARMARGEVFVVGEHYVDAGLMIELAALVHLTPAMVYNLSDGSFVVPVSISYDLTQNWLLLAGATFSHGGRDTEFGGIASPIPGYVYSPGQQAYALVAWYF